MDRRQLKDRAAALTGKRSFREALHVYDLLTHEEPSDAHVQMRRAELLLRLGEAAAASEAYSTAARLFDRMGLVQHAAAAARLAMRVGRAPAAA